MALYQNLVRESDILYIQTTSCVPGDSHVLYKSNAQVYVKSLSLYTYSA